MVDDQCVKLIPSQRIEDLHQGKFNLHSILRVNKPKKIGDPCNMSIDRQTGYVKAVTQNTVRRLASYTRQRDEFLKCPWNLTRESIKELTAAFPDILGLVFIETGSPDILF
jgi:hypothetical protein